MKHGQPLQVANLGEWRKHRAYGISHRAVKNVAHHIERFSGETLSEEAWEIVRRYYASALTQEIKPKTFQEHSHKRKARRDLDLLRSAKRPDASDVPMQRDSRETPSCESLCDLPEGPEDSPDDHVDHLEWAEDQQESHQTRG